MGGGEVVLMADGDVLPRLVTVSLEMAWTEGTVSH